MKSLLDKHNDDHVDRTHGSQKNKHHPENKTDFFLGTYITDTVDDLMPYAFFEPDHFLGAGDDGLFIREPVMKGSDGKNQGR